MLVIQLKTKIGYDKAADIANIAHKEEISLKEAAITSGYISEKDYDALLNAGKMIFPEKN